MPHRTQPADPPAERKSAPGAQLRDCPTLGDTHVDSIGDNEAHRCCTGGRSGRWR